MDGLGRFKTIWSIDFEFYGRVGDPPTPLCLAAHELKSGRRVRLWRDQFPRQCPLEIGPDSLFIAHYSTAEWNCFRALGWSLPSAVIDTYCEFRVLTNNLIYPPGSGLLGALGYFGIPTIDGTLKQTMRDLILTGGPFTLEQQQSILSYCESDTDGSAKLLKALAPGLHVPFALHRGRYMLALSAVESAGIPIDTTMLTDLRARWDSIQAELIRRIDAPYRVYEGLIFRVEAFRHYLARRGIPWPMLESGALDLKGDTFKDMSRSYPELVPLQELRSTLSALRHNSLAVGTDGRNRCMLSPFRSVTGRNQPSNSAFIFGAACWHRSLIKPPPGYAVLYLDYQQQEHGIAAALSRDVNMMAAYRSNDPYLEFAKQARMVPASATKDSHPVERDLAKQCSLAIQYAMGAEALATRINQSPAHAQQLLNLHRQTYPQFWRWSDAVVDTALLENKLETVFGWAAHYGPGAQPFNHRSARNWPMQSHGAEMLRAAIIMAVEAGLEPIGPVHDAVLFQAPLERLDATLARALEVMQKASEVILPGFPLRSDAVVVKYPDRYRDKRGRLVWETVCQLLHGSER